MICEVSTTSAISALVSPEPNICRIWRSVEMRSIARRAVGTWLCSFSAALRLISMQIVSSAATMVAPRLRPEIRPTSPKIVPAGIGTTLDGSFGSMRTWTEPEAIAKSDDPGSFFSKMVCPLA